MSKRPLSRIAPGWWDYTTLDRDLLDAAAALTADDLLRLSRPGFTVRIYDTLEDFYLAEALEYITAWRQATPAAAGRHLRANWADRAAAAGGAAGERTGTRPAPLPLLGHGRVGRGRQRGSDGLSAELCACRHGAVLQPHSSRSCACRRRTFTFRATMQPPYIASWETARCVVMQGGQGEVKHWAFNDPPQRTGEWVDQPPPPEVYRRLTTRVVDLHPITLIQNARTSGGGVVQNVPVQAISVGPRGDMEGGKGVDLACRAARQPVWHAADHVHDLRRGSRTAQCPCRCWPTIRTSSSTSTGRGSA